MKNKLQKIVTNYFETLNQLQDLVLSCYINRDYFDKRYLYEEKIQKIREKLFGIMRQARLLIIHDAKTIAQLENIYEIIFSLNTLKLRVSDYATFEVCENEIKVISKCLADIFLAHCRRPELLDEFSVFIEQFEELYKTTLQVVSQEPMVFLFFVQDLIALRDVLHEYIQDK